MTPPAPLVIPLVASDVRPFAEIARGPLATVFKAVDPSTGAVVLLKRLHAADPERRQRFADEARLAAQVDHPNVVRVLGVADGALVAEWVEGADLAATLATLGPLPPVLATFVAREAARGLAAVHAAGILHRDVSAANVLLGADGAVKLTDFGLASLTESVDGEVRGTLSTLAPEVVRGEAPTARSDLFSLGAVLAHALTGRAPFGDRGPSATLDAVLHDDPAPALAADPRVPPALAETARALLAKDPDARPAGATALADQLTATLGALGGATADDLATFLADPSAYVPPPAAPSPAAARVAPTRRWVPAGLGLVAVAGLLVLALTLTTDPGPEGRPGPPATEPPPTTAVEITLPTEEPDAAPSPLPPPALPETIAEVETPDAPTTPLEHPPPPPSAMESPPPAPVPSLDEESRPGTLALSVEPWAHVRLGDRDLGTTPLAEIPLPAGQHVVTLSNPEFPPHTVRVRVTSGGRTETVVSLWDTVGRIQLEVRPWARVTVDGAAWDTVPPQARPLILTPGAHRLGFEHPTLGTREVRLDVAAGERRTVRVRMDEE